MPKTRGRSGTSPGLRNWTEEGFLAKRAEATTEEVADLMPADSVRESVISPASPRGLCSDPLTQDLILIWELQRQAETTAKLPDQQGKSQKDKDLGERERIFIRMSLQNCRT